MGEGLSASDPAGASSTVWERGWLVIGDEAIGIAARIPAARVGSIEVRPIQKMG
jgi:hypothetical protein